jgi:hypothetical protein
MRQLLLITTLLLSVSAGAQTYAPGPTDAPYPYTGILDEGAVDEVIYPEEQQFDPEAESQYLPPAEEVYPEEEYLEEEPYY